MVTLYYLMKMSQGHDYRNMEYRAPTQNPTCRVCLRRGITPIHGNVNTPDILKALQIFCDIKVKEDDHYPKYLCNACNSFINEAILFRNKAKRTDRYLKQPLDMKVFNQDDHSTDTKPSKPNYSVKSIEINIKKEITSKDNTKIKCEICNKVFARSYYKDHIVKHDPSRKKYICEVCGKTFWLCSEYCNHRVRHQNYFPYKCPTCPYRGRSSTQLKSHMNKHTGVYKYKCTLCPARYITKSNLCHHMLKHGEPRFKCDSCDKAFHARFTLKNHYETVHLGIKNHVCNICKKAFGNRKNLRNHQLSVHKVEKLLCGNVPSYLKMEQNIKQEVED